MGSGDAVGLWIILPHWEQGWELSWWVKGQGVVLLSLSLPLASCASVSITRAPGTPVALSFPLPNLQLLLP